jgi:hypothetical protein
MINIFIGIDVGKSGAITCIYQGADWLKIKSYVTPTLPDGDIDIVEFFNILKSQDGTVSMVVIEKVHAIFGSGAGATFEFGRSAGIAEAIVNCSGLAFTMVPPKTWQKEMWAGVDKVIKAGKKSVDTKATSLIAVKRLFPKALLTDALKPKSQKAHDGIVDSILLAEYGRRLWSGNI